MQPRPSKFEHIFEHCRSWAREIRDTIGVASVQIFGSLVNKGAAQFDPMHSDLDIVMTMPSGARDAITRSEWLFVLEESKQKFELSLIPLLERDDAASPIVSVVPLTAYELERDIHKSSSREFFRVNDFLDLLDVGGTCAPMLQHKAVEVDEGARQVVEFVQGVRNKYLAVSASKKRSLGDWANKIDPAPKEIMRTAAIAKNVTTIGFNTKKTFDIQVGLDHLTYYLHAHQDENESYRTLQQWLSVRRGARGTKAELSAKNYVLLTEILFDMILSATTGKKSTRKRSDTSIDGANVQTVETRVNAYKLFYFRLNHKLSFGELSKRTGIDRSRLRKLEKIDNTRGPLDVLRFCMCDRNSMNTLEDILDCRGKLEAGREDDFLTQYLMFYDNYKGSTPSTKRASDQIPLAFETKVVVFDFDGTLTRSNDNRTTWEKLWVSVGYDQKICVDLHQRFRKKEFSHQAWCDITLDAFRKRSMRRDHFHRIAEQTSLVEGVAQTISALRKSGIRIYILSGSIKPIIRQVLGSLHTEFEEIRANDVDFDDADLISRIQGTPYDFEGKAIFLKRIIRDMRISPSDVLYVGNSCNDIFASRSGARTLCVNPRFTDPDNEEHWTYAIQEMTSLEDILKYCRI
jgi:HAD superfamily phosphoserine phosphatase-like hydrolase